LANLIICNADLIDDAGGALPFEEQALFAYGRELGLSPADIKDETCKAAAGLEGISDAEWEAMRNLDAKQKDLFFEQTMVAAGADGNYAAEEQSRLERARQLMT
jgi:hypothetical protein